MFEVKNINVSYGKSRIINNLSLRVNPRSRVAILGRNGVGKTTFLKSVMGVLPVNSGKILFRNKDIIRLKNLLRKLEELDTFRREGRSYRY